MINELSEHEQIYNVVLEKLNSIVVVINKHGELIYVSPSVTNVLGFEPNELIGFNWWKETRKSVHEGLEAFYMYQKLLTENKICSYTKERILLDKNGQEKWITWDSFFDENENLISIGHDITIAKKREHLLEKSNLELKLKQKETFESITYAQTIQNAILPNNFFLQNYFTQSFVFYEAKDIVSGDLYFFYEFENHLFIACIDCTGHGVPGALMTILANSLLKNIIKHQKLKKPSDILHALDDLLFEEFNKNKQIKRADGMDISLCVFELEKNIMHFSGANHHLIYMDNASILHEFKGNRYPIGLYHDVVKRFETKSFLYSKGDKIILTSDGFLDQFGGEKNKRFTRKRFYEFLKYTDDFYTIERNLTQVHQSWKGQNEQTDDILILGFEI